jgi:hypothetical protein
MRIDEKIFNDLQGKTKKELRLQLSHVQNEVYKNSTKSQIIAQIRLNIIVGSEQIGMGVKNE